MTRLLLLGALLMGLGCSPANESDVVPEPSAPATPQAVAIMEPPRIEIGDTARVEVAVSVPPGSRVSSLRVPDDTPGLWVLEAVGPRVENQAGRDVHRTVFRVRARATGTFAWPGDEILAFTPEGEEFRVTLAPRPFRVSTVSDEVPGQRTFFSYREPSALPSAGGGGVLLPGLIGALLAYASVGLLMFVRRTRSAAEAPTEAPPSTAPWRAAQAALAAANEIAEEDPVRAADMASAALRHYIDGRFGTDTASATTEELRTWNAPFLLTTRWDTLLPLLEDFDRERFPPAQADRAAQTASLRDVIGRAQAWVSDAAPRGNLS